MSPNAHCCHRISDSTSGRGVGTTRGPATLFLGGSVDFVLGFIANFSASAANSLVIPFGYRTRYTAPRVPRPPMLMYKSPVFGCTAIPVGAKPLSPTDSRKTFGWLVYVAPLRSSGQNQILPKVQSARKNPPRYSFGNCAWR